MSKKINIEKLIACADAKQWKFWISESKKRAAIRELANHAGDIQNPILIYKVARLFSKFPREAVNAIHTLRKWIKFNKGVFDGILDSKVHLPGEKGVMAGIRCYTAITLGSMGSLAKEVLNDLRQSYSVETDNFAKEYMKEAIEDIERKI